MKKLYIAIITLLIISIIPAVAKENINKTRLAACFMAGTSYGYCTSKIAELLGISYGVPSKDTLYKLSLCSVTVPVLYAAHDIKITIVDKQEATAFTDKASCLVNRYNTAFFVGFLGTKYALDVLLPLGISHLANSQLVSQLVKKLTHRIFSIGVPSAVQADIERIKKNH